MCGNCAVYFSNRIEKCEYEPPFNQAVNSKNKPTKESTPLAPKPAHSSEVDREAISGTVIRRCIFGANPSISNPIGSVLDPFEMHPGTRLPAADKLLYHCK